MGQWIANCICQFSRQYTTPSSTTQAWSPTQPGTCPPPKGHSGVWHAPQRKQIFGQGFRLSMGSTRASSVPGPGGIYRPKSSVCERWFTGSDLWAFTLSRGALKADGLSCRETGDIFPGGFKVKPIHNHRFSQQHLAIETSCLQCMASEGRPEHHGHSRVIWPRLILRFQHFARTSPAR